MKLLITGASGFLGNEVAKQLGAIFKEVHGVDLVPGKFVSTQLDVASRDFSFFTQAVQPTNIVHLAGVQYLVPVPRSYRDSFFQANISMALNVAESMRKLATIRHVVFVSTDMVYGKTTDSPISRQSPLRPIGPYGRSKALAEDILLEASRETGVALTILRPRLIAGAGRLGTLEKLHNLITRDLPVPVIGDGLNQYQFVAKEDVAGAVALSIGKESRGIYNLGSDNPPSVNELLSSAIQFSGSKSSLLHLNRSLAIRALRFLDSMGISPLSPEQFEIASLNCILDTSETKGELGWQPSKSDIQMLLESFDYLSIKNV
jgi:dTDP-glucose 4,6-dehydratase